MSKVEEKLKEAKRLYETANADQKYVLESLFPELKESEDERIRKALIEYCRNARCVTEEGAEIIAKWIAWLEKQVEHAKFRDSIQVGDKVTRNQDGVLVNLSQLKRVAKHADKVEPKFKQGEWLVENEPNNYARFIQILEIVDVQGKERYRISRDLHNDEDVAECRFIENNYHPFTIQDAKDGDVLVNKHGCPLIFKDRETCWCYYSISSEVFHLNSNRWFFSSEDYLYPATKEQRDLLFQKMKESGYEWDAEKKELKKIEDESSWGEEDKEMINNIIDYMMPMPIFFESTNGKSGKEYTQEFVKNAINWLKSFKPQLQWKPSDEQMKALWNVYQGGKEQAELATLYNDLKKLKAL